MGDGLPERQEAGLIEGAAGTPAPKVLFISADPVGKDMAGLGIRYWELARALSAHASVTVAHGGASAGIHDDVELLPYRVHAPGRLRGPIAAADLVVTHPQWPVIGRWLRDARARVVFDLYDPETLEALELFAGRRAVLRRLMVNLTLDRLEQALCNGSHFICASEKQRDLWLGALLARRLIEPDAYDRDPSLRSVIGVVPFGVPSQPPRASGRNPIRELFPQIGPDDHIALWNGGIWGWLDAPTAVRAAALVAKQRAGFRLVFMGNSAGGASRAATVAARALAAQLGLLDRVVLFNDLWVPYDERADWLMSASCAVATQGDHLETRFAFRTRLLDCFWAGLPIVSTSGDDLGDMVSRDCLGETVLPDDPQALASAIERVLLRGRGAYAESLAGAAAHFAWPRAAEHLVRLLDSTSPARAVGRHRRASVSRRMGPLVRAAAYRAGRRALDASTRRR
jgi:glycosyltransferase involved in cell wall biosynthesis